jgi:hypothetical protein
VFDQEGDKVAKTTSFYIATVEQRLVRLPGDGCCDSDGFPCHNGNNVGFELVFGGK